MLKMDSALLIILDYRVLCTVFHVLVIGCRPLSLYLNLSEMRSSCGMD
jgi:hypothetical protein